MTDPVTDAILQDREHDEALAVGGKMEAEVWIVSNELGDYQLGIDESQAAEDFASTYGGDRRRTFRLRLVLPLPVVTGATGEVPDAEGNDFNVEVRPS